MSHVFSKRLEGSFDDTVASMQAIENPGLKAKAGQVADRLRAAIARL